MRFLEQRKKASIWAAALALSIVAVLLTALPGYAAQVTVTSLTPNTGPPGTGVVILGTNFQNGNVSSVTFNGVAAAFTITDGTHISATAPCSTTGVVHVTNATGTDTDNVPFTYTAAGLPTVTGFSPTFGTAGTTVVTITGTNLCSASVVKFNATNATSFIVNSPTQITATVPAGATTGKITVTTPINTGVSAANFVIGLPVISSFSPIIGPVGTTVTITGSNFTGVTGVRFNGTAATFTVVSATSITTAVPSGATTGAISVTNPVGTATGATYTVGEATHGRSVSFAFEPNSRVSGQVTVADNFAACNTFVPVVIQKQNGGGWKWVDTTSTTKSGSFKTYIPPSSGTFRVKVNKQTLLNGSACLGDTSPGRHHNA